MTAIVVSPVNGPAVDEGAVEIVERKGLGHPDTICDALAETVSQALCGYYLDRFGVILHHNVDKALLWVGAAAPAFGGGRVEAPMEVFLAGRATRAFQGQEVPVDEIVHHTVREWLCQNLHALAPEPAVKIHSLVRPGSADLVDLYLRERETGVALANDTSCGAGYAPLSELEQIVAAVERHLNHPARKRSHPVIGEDVKVMGVRQGGAIALTVACAMVDRHCADMDAYLRQVAMVRDQCLEVSARLTGKPVSVEVNNGDSPQTGSVYITVTGTSAEAGDDGQVGRGNRVNGLITPYRPMTMEAAAGKNPVTHVGKLYNIAAQRMAEALVRAYPEVSEAYCYLVSRIGAPVHEPQAVDLRLRVPAGVHVNGLRPRPAEIVDHHLSTLPRLRDELLTGALRVF